VLLEQVTSELVANVISHGPLGGIIIRGTSQVAATEGGKGEGVSE